MSHRLTCYSTWWFFTCNLLYVMILPLQCSARDDSLLAIFCTCMILHLFQIYVWSSSWQQLVVLYVDYHFVLHGKPRGLPDRRADADPYWVRQWPHQAVWDPLRNISIRLFSSLLWSKWTLCLSSLWIV